MPCTNRNNLICQSAAGSAGTLDNSFLILDAVRLCGYQSWFNLFIFVPLDKILGAGCNSCCGGCCKRLQHADFSTTSLQPVIDRKEREKHAAFKRSSPRSVLFTNDWTWKELAMPKYGWSFRRLVPRYIEGIVVKNVVLVLQIVIL